MFWRKSGHNRSRLASSTIYLMAAAAWQEKMVLPSLAGLIGRSHRGSAVWVLWVELDWLPQIFPQLENGCRTRKGKWEKKFGFLATVPGNSDCPETNPLPNRYVAFLPVEPLLLVQTYQGSVGANENMPVLNMNICVSLIFAKLSTDFFCFLLALFATPKDKS